MKLLKMKVASDFEKKRARNRRIGLVPIEPYQSLPCIRGGIDAAVGIIAALRH